MDLVPEYLQRYVCEGRPFDRPQYGLPIRQLDLRDKKRFVELGADVNALDDRGRNSLQNALWISSTDPHHDVCNIARCYYDLGGFLLPSEDHWFHGFRYAVVRTVLGWGRVYEDVARMVAEMLV